jgi:hypothetical protein
MGMSWASLEGRPYTSGYVLNGFEHRSRRIIRRRQQLQNRQRTVCEIDAVGESTASVNCDAHVMCCSSPRRAQELFSLRLDDESAHAGVIAGTEAYRPGFVRTVVVKR